MKYNPTPSKQLLTWGTLDEVPPKVFPAPYILKGQAIFGMSGVVASYSLETDWHASLAAPRHPLVLTGI